MQPQQEDSHQPQVFQPTNAGPSPDTSVAEGLNSAPSNPQLPTVPAVFPVQPEKPNPSFNQQPVTSGGGRRGKKKLILLAAIPLVLLLGGTTAAYFGYYVPNKPENVWASALERTGKAYDELAKFVDSSSKQKNSSYDGDFKVSGSVAADGTIKGSSGSNGSRLYGDVSTAGIKVNYDVRAINSARSTPDIYIKINGISGLGDLFGLDDPTISQALNGINNQWYVVDHSLFDQFAQGSNSSTQITMKDVDEVLKAIGDSSKTYVFTKNTVNMTFTNQHSLGKEKQDGKTVYHYKVGINKVNLKKYNNDLCDRLIKTKLFKLLGDGSASETMDECKDTTGIDKIDSTTTADVWVDAKTKLIHKVRYSQKSDQANTFDIFQDYQGGDEIPLGLNVATKDSNTRVDIKLNKSTNVIVIKATSKGSGDNKYSAEFNFTVKPAGADTQIEVPKDAKNIITLLNDLGFGDLISSTGSDIQEKAKDTERKTDINAIHSQLEAYNAQNGYYPTLAQVNDASWRAQNMKGLDAEALKDPDGTTAQLTGSDESTRYVYQATPAGCGGVDQNSCTQYTLTATLSEGGTYVKVSLN